MSLGQALAEAEHLPPAPPEVRWVATKDTLKNQTERDYWAHLHARLLAGEIVDFRYEALTFRLGHDCRFSPDFMVLLPDGRVEFHEVKGFCEEDAKVKLKTFATLYPYWPLYVVTRERPLAGWDIKRVPALTR